MPQGNNVGKSKVREYIEIIVTAVVLALIVRAFVIQSYHIPSESMEDTLLNGDFLFASKFIFSVPGRHFSFTSPINNHYFLASQPYS